MRPPPLRRDRRLRLPGRDPLPRMHDRRPTPDTGGGWLIPNRLALCDVLEFGPHSPAASRWYGIVDSYELAAWLTVQGPYPDPGAAHAEPDRLLAGERRLPP